MKILLDECLNWRLKREFQSHEVFTVHDMGWSGIVNGMLLEYAQREGFQIFVTIDKRLRYQQNIAKFNLSIVILETRLNKLEYLRPLIPDLIDKLPTMNHGSIYEIS